MTIQIKALDEYILTVVEHLSVNNQIKTLSEFILMVAFLTFAMLALKSLCACALVSILYLGAAAKVFARTWVTSADFYISNKARYDSKIIVKRALGFPVFSVSMTSLHLYNMYGISFVSVSVSLMQKKNTSQMYLFTFT